MNTGSKLARRAVFEWRLSSGVVRLGERTLIMGVINLTPDSFSDGGSIHTVEEAVHRGLEMLDLGADILDVGGESTRPGSKFIEPEEEMRRVLPVIQALRKTRPKAILSIDTSKALVARAAVRAGADIVNDVSGLLWDESMAHTCAGLGCGMILMHTRGRPDVWKHLPALRRHEVLPMVREGLADCLARATAVGMDLDRVALDPGFGFGKTGDENYPLLAGMGELAALGRPLVAGVSRKSFLGRTLAEMGERDALAVRRWNEVVRGMEQMPGAAALGLPPAGGVQYVATETRRKTVPAAQRLMASMAATTATVLAGAHIVRVHDVHEAAEAVAVADAVLRGVE
jgi:dihydropteroate synthase